jgi:hypothetical protein
LGPHLGRHGGTIGVAWGLNGEAWWLNRGGMVAQFGEAWYLLIVTDTSLRIFIAGYQQQT